MSKEIPYLAIEHATMGVGSRAHFHEIAPRSLHPYWERDEGEEEDGGTPIGRIVPGDEFDYIVGDYDDDDGCPERIKSSLDKFATMTSPPPPPPPRCSISIPSVPLVFFCFFFLLKVAKNTSCTTPITPPNAFGLNKNQSFDANPYAAHENPFTVIAALIGQYKLDASCRVSISFISESGDA